MADCPKCGRHLKITDMKPTCPGCGVNLLYYKIEERLEVDAINAELEHAKTQQKVDRAKASWIGSPLTIVRLVFLVLAVGMLFLPLATLHTAGPYFDKTTTFNAIEVYNQVSALDFDGLFVMMKSPLLGASFTMLLVSAVTIAVSAVCALLDLILSFLSCSPHGFIRNTILCSLGIVSTVASIITYNKAIGGLSTALPGFVSGGVSFGAFLVIFAFVLCLGINIAIKVKGVDVKYKNVFVDKVPYETFVEKFGIKKYDLESLSAIKEEIKEYQVEA